MFPVPVTYLFDFSTCTEAMYPLIMEDFARNGAKHLVLSDYFINEITRGSSKLSLIEKSIQDSGLTFCDAHGVFGMEWCLNCPIKPMWNAMIHQQKLALDICQYFNVKTITIHVGSMRHLASQSKTREEHIETIKESLAELLPYAEKRDVIICIENIWHHINAPESLLEVKEAFPTPYLGFCFDAGHANIMNNGRLHPTGEAWTGWKYCKIDTPPWDDKVLEKMLPHIVNCHLHDNDGSKDAHTLPGKGNIDWDHLLALLVKAPRLKVIQSEVIPVKNGISIPLLCKTFQKMEKDLSLR